MYEIPSRQDISRCKITEKVILKEESPLLEPVRLPAREEEELTRPGRACLIPANQGPPEERTRTQRKKSPALLRRALLARWRPEMAYLLISRKMSVRSVFPLFSALLPASTAFNGSSSGCTC